MCAPTTTIGVYLAPPNNNLSRPISQKIKIRNFKRGQLRPPGQNVISNMEEGLIPVAERAVWLQINDFSQ